MNKSRRGISLAELLIVMSACAVVLTLSTALIHRVMRIHSNARSFEQRERSAMRLSAYFRQDVHEARQALPEDIGLSGGVFLRLRGNAERRIEYHLGDSTILRLSCDGEAVLSRETFHFNTPVQVKIVEETIPRALTLSLSEPYKPTTNGEDSKQIRTRVKPIAFQVTAVVGRSASYPVVNEEDPT